MRHEPFCAAALGLCLLGAALGTARADVLTWTAANTGDWFVVDNWTNTTTPESTRVPADGDDAVIASAGATVLLNSSSAALGSLLVSNATLCFSNWDTLLSATTLTVEKSGVLTCIGPFTNSAMSNRVNLACDTLLVAAGGAINVNDKGYAGGLAVGGDTWSAGHGPGGYAGAGGSYGGGGLLASAFINPYYMTNLYGSATAPIDPGSGGGIYGSVVGKLGGHGGGAVCITAVQVVVNGSISANSSTASGYNYGCGGSGGGIYIACVTIDGTNGTVTANGGHAYAIGNGGGSGGGRIAVLYDPVAQRGRPAPAIRFSAASGLSAYTASPKLPGDIGTLYFPDSYFFSPTNLFTGQWLAPGLTNDIVLPDWVVSNVWARLPGLNVTVSQTLTVAGTDYGRFKLELTNSSAIQCAQLRISGASFVLGHGYETNLTSPDLYLAPSGSTLNCTGDLILTNAGRFYVSAGLTNSGAGSDYGARVAVGGDLRVASNCWILPAAHPTSGASVLFTMQNLTIDSNGGFNADARGYAGGIRPGTSNAAHGPGCAAAFNAGSGYGGVGGTGCYNSVASAGGLVYGNANYPVAPGSGARAGIQTIRNGVYNGAFGGGSVQIRASDTCALYGRITANALAGCGDYGPGASGGGIYIRCNTFIGSSNGLLQANGGISAYGPVYPAGPGGGGRIAVWRVNDFSESAISNTADPGARYGVTGGAGTIVWGWLPSAGTIITLH